MPAQHSDEFKLGLTVIIIIVLFFGTLIFIGGAAVWGPKTRAVRVHFAHSMALPVLKPGGEVRCGGQRVGSIQSVALHDLTVDRPESRPAHDQDGSDRSGLTVVVIAEVDRAVGLRSDCKITAEGPTLGGDRKSVV